MIQGTHSDAGKSIITTALCRIFSEDGLKTAPFKSQNMSLNSYITVDGREIGRAQGIQAEAAGIEATTNMNPILIKPTRDQEAQIVVHGEPIQNMQAFQYRQDFFETGLRVVKEAYNSLASEYDCIVLEGAGSPAEVNLNDREMVNMRVARIADAPVILVGDIDKGGVFASLVGTLQLLKEADRARVVGVIINKFRGDLSLLQPGLDWFETYTGIPVLGVVPYLENLEIDGEDSLSLQKYEGEKEENELDIAVLSYPRISNFTDIDPLRLEWDCRVRFVRKPSDLQTPDILILPGSKNTIEDLQWLRQQGFEPYIKEAQKRGAFIVGICGGYQMLGQHLFDPHYVESPNEQVEGLAYLPIETTLTKKKKTIRVTGESFLNAENMIPLEGYEIHMGETCYTESVQPFAVLNGEQEGCLVKNILGTYLHDVFHNDVFRRTYLNRIRNQKGLSSIEETMNIKEEKEKQFVRLSSHIRSTVNINQLYDVMEQYANKLKGNEHEKTNEYR